MYYSKPVRYKKQLRIKLAVILIVFAIGVIAVNIVINNMISDTVISISKNKASQAVNDAVQEVLGDGIYDYTNFVEIVNGEDGAVQSVSARSDLINRFKSELGRAVINKLETDDISEFDIAVGTLTDIGMFYDRGPRINIRLKQYGEMTTHLESTFVAEGINQTRHRITCCVTANIAVITSGATYYTSVKGEYLISETVIIGKIPDSYTNVNGDDSGIIGQIFDYADIE